MTRRVLHVGCGSKTIASMPEIFRTGEWAETRLDINPDANPDILCSMTDMAPVPTASFDAVWSAHNLEHLYFHEVVPALREFARVVRPGGFVMVAVPDLQTVAERIAQGRIDEPIYTSPAGPVCPLDVIYGLRPALEAGNEFMAHKMGFTAESLGECFIDAGLGKVRVQRRPGRLEVRAWGERLPDGVAATSWPLEVLPPAKRQPVKPAPPDTRQTA